MRSTSFKSVLSGTLALAGLNLETLPDAQSACARFCEFINQRTREAWEYDAWPELVTIENRQFCPQWDAASTYAPGTQVWFADDQLFYTANLAPNNPAPGESPATSPAKWTEGPRVSSVIPLDSPGRTSIAEVLGVTQSDPRQSAGFGRLPYAMIDSGILVRSAPGNTVWVRFRLAALAYTAIPYDNTRTYSAGELCFDYNYSTHEGTGECCRALRTTQGNGPTALVYWEKVPVPYVLEQFIKRAAYSDVLRDDGQYERAGREQAAAYNTLSASADTALATQGQFATVSVSTY